MEMVKEIKSLPVKQERSSRFVPNETNSTELEKAVDEKLRSRTSSAASWSESKIPYAETSIETILLSQGIDPRSQSKAPQTESPAQDDDDQALPPELPVKKRSSGRSTTSSIGGETNAYNTPVVADSTQEITRRQVSSSTENRTTPLDHQEVPTPTVEGPTPAEGPTPIVEGPTPVPRKKSLKRESLTELSAGTLSRGEDIMPKEINNENQIPQTPNVSTSPVITTANLELAEDIAAVDREDGKIRSSFTDDARISRRSYGSDTSDGRVSDAIREIEGLVNEVDEEMKRRPKKCSITETGETVMIMTGPPAPMLPPPPPVPGLSGLGALFAKKLKRPATIKLKAFHWDKVPKNLCSKSLWKKAADLTDTLDAPLLEEMFADERITASKSEANSALPDKTTRTLLDTKRAQNLGIVLAGLKMGVSQLQEKLNLIREDDGALPLDQVGMLRRLQPTPDDIEMYRAYKGDPEELERADKFLMELCEIPQLSVRLDLLNDVMELPTQYRELEPAVKHLEDACAELLNAGSFVRVLEYVLAIGNYLNSGAGKPAVDGFQLSSLNKLMESRGKDKKFTLLHYLVQFLGKHQPDLLTFYKSMPHVSECTELSIGGLSAEIEVMRRYLIKIQKNAKTLKKQKSSTLENKFQQDVQSFVNEYEKLLKHLSDQCSDVASKFKKAMEYYGEPADKDSEEVFSSLALFLANFQKLATEQEKKKVKPSQTLANVLMEGSRRPGGGQIKGNSALVVGTAGLRKTPSPSTSSTTSVGRPTKDGYLEISLGAKNTRATKWEKRFIEISSTGYLHYYKKQFDKNLGSVYLRGCAIAHDVSDNKVISVDSESSDLRLRATSGSTADEWFCVLSHYGEKI